ncbi:hypothetical protein ACIRRA_42805 [Nocardia sp. NPDC101769]|uniref:hypothetical protein n=1 Tax=Nocardia sp. NPDC101769 TaxID=3364333 RepID=UPI003830DF59
MTREWVSPRAARQLRAKLCRELSRVGEYRRGHGSVYTALDRGRIDIARLRRAPAGVPLPRATDG